MSEDTGHKSSAHVGNVTKRKTVGFTQRRQKDGKEEAECEPTSRGLVSRPRATMDINNLCVNSKETSFHFGHVQYFFSIYYYFFLF